MADTDSNRSPPPPPTSNNGSMSQAVRFVCERRWDAFLLAVRLATLAFTFLYIVPLTSYSSASLYQKALLGNAAVSAFRVHQRLPPFVFSREYLALLMAEDSAHYLLFSLIFLYNQPITMVLLPICIFSLLHSCNFILNILGSMGPLGPFGQKLAAFVNGYQRQMLLTVALTEITLMPTIIFSIMAGLATIFTPVLYYQFLVLRYASRRNPYTRQAFHWLRVSIEQKLLTLPQCPQFVRDIMIKGIAIISRQAPVQM